MEEVMIGQDQANAIKTLLGRLRLWKQKEKIVIDFSLRSSSKISELTSEEADKCIAYLVQKDEESNKMRKRMLSIGYQLHWDKPRTPAEEKMDAPRINYNRVSNFLEKDPRSKFKKAIHQLNPFELVDALLQLEEILKATKAQLKKHYAKV